jgi:hypothetical protein
VSTRLSVATVSVNCTALSTGILPRRNQNSRALRARGCGAGSTAGCPHSQHSSFPYAWSSHLTQERVTVVSGCWRDDYLTHRGSQAAYADAWAIIERTSSGERLWCRVEAYMAQRIEASKGHVVLVALVKQGLAQFIATYESLVSSQTTR